MAEEKRYTRQEIFSTLEEVAEYLKTNSSETDNSKNDNDDYYMILGIFAEVMNRLDKK